jgi:gas vesicle protein
METQENDKSVLMSVLAGIGIGVIVGGIAGLMFAPKAGMEMRESVTKTLADLGEKINQVAQQVSTKVGQAADTAAQSVDNAANGSDAQENPSA